MSYWSKLRNFTAIAVGCGTGISVYLYLHRSPEALVHTLSSRNNTMPSQLKWNYNWDHRNPDNLVTPLKSTATSDEKKKYNERINAVKPIAVRHLILVRHGEYNLNGATDADRYLTEIGRMQATYTAERLKALQFPFDKMVWSTMRRAQETGKIISTQIDHIPIENCSMLEEGYPIPPQPPINNWYPEPHYFYQDGARIEAAFRKYFHRASVKQPLDSFTLLVCHATVIRYFVCRALQIPPEAWFRISLNHASITWISIEPSGRVTLRLLGDSGHIPPEHATT